MNDPHDLNRFLLAQKDDYERALAEVKNGRKRTHWMWYIFPQIDGLGFSSMARRYGIKSADETRAYLAHPTLGSRLLACAEAVVANAGSNATEIFGSPDDLKLRCCDHPPRSLPACPRQTRCSTVCWRSSMQAVLTRKRSGCSASATSVEGSTFAVHRRSGGAVRTVSLLLFKAIINARTIWRLMEFKRIPP